MDNTFVTLLTAEDTIGTGAHQTRVLWSLLKDGPAYN